MRRLLPLSSAVALAGCSLPFGGPDCIDESRSLTVSGRLVSVAPDAAPGDTGFVGLSLGESRNHRSKRTSRQDVSWSVRSGLTRSTVVAVHVHEQTTDRLLFDVPIDSTTGPAPVITQVFQGRPYAGPIPWTQLYDALGDGRAYADVHTTARPAGALRGPLAQMHPGWQRFTHAYCS